MAGLLQRLGLAAAAFKSGMSSLDLFREIYGGREARSGVSVNAATAIEVATVLACVRTLAEGVAQVPFRVYRQQGAARQPAPDHPLAAVLTAAPNPWQTSFEFRETLVFHVALTGNAFVFVNRVGSNRDIRELIPIEPGRVQVERQTGGGLVYKVQGDDAASGVQTFQADAIWHLRGPSWNAWMGLDATRLAREAIGLSISLERGQADFQKNGAKTSGLFSMKESLTPERYKLLREWFEKELAGSGAYRPLILDRGAEYTPFTMTGVDQQLLETRKHQIEEICRTFRVMPIMVGHADKTQTYASAEQMFLAHVVHTLTPWYARFEQSADARLLGPADRQAGYYTKFMPNALMRGAAKDRAEFYTRALGSGGSDGWMTPNEVRGLEEMDPVAGGDDLPRRMMPTAKPPSDPADPAPAN